MLDVRSSRRPGWILAGVLLLALGLRLPRLNSPPIGHQAWRQADTAAISRNFVQEEFDPLRPRVDWRGDTAGYVESEAPLYSFVVAILYRFFGVREWLARLVTLICSLGTIALLYSLGREARDAATGLWAAFFLAVLPMPIFFGRAIMPESLMLVGLVGAVWAFLRYRRHGGLRWVLLTTLSLATACLVKPLCLYLGLPLAWLAFRRHGWRFPLTPALWIVPAMVGAALLTWYEHAHALFRETGLTFGIWEYGSDKWGDWRLLATPEFWSRVFLYRLPKLGLAWAGVPLFLHALLFVRRSGDERLFDAWLGGLLVYVVLVARGVFVHDYYLLPAALPISYYLGLACAELGRRAETDPGRGGSIRRVPPVRSIGRAVLVLGVLAMSISIVARWYRSEDRRRSHLLPIARLVREQTPAEALVVCLDEKDPTLLYLSQRKGWHATAAEVDSVWLREKVVRGARTLFGVYRPRGARNRSPYLETLLARAPDAPRLPEGGFLLGLRAPTSP